MKPVHTAVIGCGAISDIYLSNMINRFPTLEVTACCATHLENAKRKAAQYGILPSTTNDILADPDIELVVVLTPAPTHYELIKQALLAGKHVYTEKPLAAELWQARELIALAQEKGLRLGAAPETFMGSALQTARKALDDGLIGEVTSFHVVVNRDLTLLASLFKFLRMPYGGICYDFGVYFLTALIALLGPVDQVYAKVGNHARIRKNSIPSSPEFGEDFVYDNEAQVNAVLTLKNGITGSFSLNGDSTLKEVPLFRIMGTKGILDLNDANQFGGSIRYLPGGQRDPNWQDLEMISPLSGNSRGIGPADMARCIREGGTHLASMEMACHVLDVMEKILKSGSTNLPQDTETSCVRPAAFDSWRELLPKEAETDLP